MKKGKNNVKVKFMAITIVLALVLSLVLALAGPVAASPPSWNVSGTWVFSYGEGNSYGSHYDLTLTQTGTSLSGSAGYPAGSPPPQPYQYTFSLTAGSVFGNTIIWTATYGSLGDPAAVGCTLNVTGTIASDGTMSGTWTDDYPSSGGARNGLWKTTNGHATPITLPVAATIGVTGEWVAPTVTFTAPGSSINLGTLYPNTTTAWGYTGQAGSVSFVQGSDTGATYVLSVGSAVTPNVNDGHMQTSADWSYLANPLYVALGTESSLTASNVDTDGGTSWTYGNLPNGPASFTVPTTGVLYYFDVAAQQVMGAGVPTAGTYGITINVSATYTP